MGVLKILLGGDGNISKALRCIVRMHGGDYDFHVVDIKEGTELLQEIKNHGKEYDVVVNLTDAAIDPFYQLCAQMGIDYIDASMEGDENMLTQYLRMISYPHPESRMLCGWGMNPGLIEYMYELHKPKGRHYAIEFETDSAMSEKGKVFGTWCVPSYYSESVESAPTIYSKNKSLVEFEAQKLTNLTYNGVLHQYKLIPHEETISIVNRNENCLGSCFLYQAPIGLQTYFNDHHDLSEKEVHNIPVYHGGLTGDDTVGMLIYEVDGEQPYYIYNTASHETKFEQYGINGTCWQTASGVYLALEYIKHLPKGATCTLTDAAKKNPEYFARELRRLHFDIDIQKECMEQDYVLEHIIHPLFGDIPV